MLPFGIGISSINHFFFILFNANFITFYLEN
jgi:hypothetical protein